MNMDKKSISSVIEDINFYTIKCFDDNYDFQGEFEELDKIDSEKSIIEKFLHSYLCKVNFLCSYAINDAEVFLQWYREKGKSNLMPLIGEIDYSKINFKKLIRIFMRYDILMEQAVYEKNPDSLLNLLIDIPMSIYQKLQEWNCLNVEVNELKRHFFEQYESNILKANNLKNLIPAEMQVFLL